MKTLGFATRGLVVNMNLATVTDICQYANTDLRQSGTATLYFATSNFGSYYIVIATVKVVIPGAVD